MVEQRSQGSATRLPAVSFWALSPLVFLVLQQVAAMLFGLPVWGALQLFGAPSEGALFTATAAVHGVAAVAAAWVIWLCWRRFRSSLA